jgi:hypothetical protein
MSPYKQDLDMLKAKLIENYIEHNEFSKLVSLYDDNQCTGEELIKATRAIADKNNLTMPQMCEKMTYEQKVKFLEYVPEALHKWFSVDDCAMYLIHKNIRKGVLNDYVVDNRVELTNNTLTQLVIHYGAETSQAILDQIYIKKISPPCRIMYHIMSNVKAPNEEYLAGLREYLKIDRKTV